MLLCNSLSFLCLHILWLLSIQRGNLSFFFLFCSLCIADHRSYLQPAQPPNTDSTDGASSSGGAEGEPGNSESNRKGKRSRIAFTEAQLDELELEFHKNKYPSMQSRKKIARQLNIKEDRIQVSSEALPSIALFVCFSKFCRCWWWNCTLHLRLSGVYSFTNWSECNNFVGMYDVTQ